jgi:hypothetical protein
LPIPLAIGRLQAAIGVAQVPEPSPADRRVLSGVCAAAWQAFHGKAWTVSHLVDLGAIEPSESRTIGRLVARHAGHRDGGLELVPAGQCRDGLRWRLRVSR